MQAEWYDSIIVINWIICLNFMKNNLMKEPRIVFFIKWPFTYKRPFRSLITNRLLIIASKIAAE